ncbi:MAG: pyridoxal phosphate-dependent aminotransferase [Chloroflexota bacterium]|nr:MAG: pyridoxal phosphate-dependent aminotransferase [Chloroflexota bacterium]
MVTDQRTTASRRAREALPSPIRKLTPLAERAKAEGVHVHHLNIGQPDLPIPQSVIDSIRAFGGPLLPYAPSQGISEVIDAWRDYYAGIGLRFERNEVLVTAGGSESLQFAMMAVADPGDEIMVFEPTYANYFGFAKMASVEISPVVLRAEDGYHLPKVSEIETHVTPRTRALLFTTPGNPTGTVYSYRELEILSEVAARHDLFLIADETYREIVFEGARNMSAMKIDATADRTILVDTVSKRFSATGARVGCIASHHRGVMDGALRFAQARLSAPTVEQLAMVPVLRDPRPYTDRLAEVYRRRRDVVYGALSKFPGVRVRRPEGAFYVFAVFPIDDGERFASWLLSDFRSGSETVMVAPGDGFYSTPGLGKQEIRLACVLEETVLARAMEILEEALRAYPGSIYPGRKVQSE